MTAGILSLVVAGSSGALTPADVVGAWAGEAIHDGRVTAIGFVFEPTDSGRVEAQLSLPEIHAYGYPMGRVSAHGDTVRCGPFTLVSTPGDTLRGELPADLAPVHTIPFGLARGTVARTPRPEPAAPIVAPVWTFDTGAAVWADVAFANGVVYVGDDAGRLHALDARSGERRWVFAAAGAIRARPTLAGDDLYVQADDGLLYKLSARRGKVRWKIRVADSSIVRLPFSEPGSKFDARASAVTLGEQRLYVGTHDGRVLALDSANGARAWSFATRGPVLASPAVNAGIVYAGSYDGKVYAIDAASGEERWAHDTRGAVTSMPMIVAGTVLAGSRSYDLAGLDAATGAVAWNRYVWFSWIESTPAFRDGIAYVGSSDAAKVFAIEARTGRSVWETDVHGIAWGQPAILEDRMFVGTQGSPFLIDHRAQVWALDRATGAAVWRFPYAADGPSGQHGFAGSAAAGDGRVYIASTDGRLFAFEAVPP